MISFIDGGKYCCEGAVAGNQCQGRKVCAMSPGVTDVSSCAQYLYDYTKLMSEKHCFGTMPHYYEDDSQVPSISGCASQVNSNYSAPADGITEKDSCKVYLTEYENVHNTDSCVNKKMEVDLQQSEFCKKVGCTTSMWKYQTNPPLHRATYSNPGAVTNGSTAGDPNISPKTCQWQPSALRYVKEVLPDNQDLINKVSEGSLPWICGYMPPMPCNKKVKYIVVKGGGYIQISQIVAKDMKGNNVAKGSQVWASPSKIPESKKEFVADGTEATRDNQDLYMSTSKAEDTIIYITLSTPTCISEIILYGQSGGLFRSRHANKTVMLLGEKPDINNPLWSAQTNRDMVQRFIIPPNTFA
jgi:hypothetical protein